MWEATMILLSHITREHIFSIFFYFRIILGQIHECKKDENQIWRILDERYTFELSDRRNPWYFWLYPWLRPIASKFDNARNYWLHHMCIEAQSAHAPPTECLVHSLYDLTDLQFESRSRLQSTYIGRTSFDSGIRQVKTSGDRCNNVNNNRCRWQPRLTNKKWG